MDMGGGEMADPEPGKPLRALNRDLETYVWKEEQGQLYRVSPGAGPVHGELLVFPPGSYYKVYKDDLEIIPSDAAPRSNDWIRGQSCVAECKGFRIENKRPATIRHHFASCKLRDSLTTDPIGRLCKLQIDAGK
ncbi:hypothetical protein BCR35DRAFT_308586 [Leucosporidium creatinivorum]|uniref:Uncharacterized protein n=1 Tax=Leucosporidium creatinivorum TaxID=106004 RepID=A0A1Y2E450_9BASI|nr:hypothetical protein BCR35DRAFT_308586 [Leucosporidium creatinivorum]